MLDAASRRAQPNAAGRQMIVQERFIVARRRGDEASRALEISLQLWRERVALPRRIGDRGLVIRCGTALIGLRGKVAHHDQRWDVIGLQTEQPLQRASGAGFVA